MLHASVHANAAVVSSGKCGESVTYELDSNGNLTISGTGEMYNFSSSDWYKYGGKGYYDSISSVTINKGVTSVGKNAFEDCKNLKSVNLSDDIANIGSRAFKGCTGITSIKIPDNVTAINDYVFYGCENIAEVKLSANLKSIGDHAFYNCYGITEISLPDGLKTLGDYSLSYCKNLNSISIPDSVTSIGNSAFANCYNISSVKLPHNTATIGNWAFYMCYSNLKNIDIPDGISSIGDYAFYECSKVETVSIADSVTAIGNGAFDNTNIKDVYFMGTETQWDSLGVAYNGDDVHFNGIKETVESTPITAQIDDEIGATGFTATLENIKGRETSAADLLWRVNSNGTTKEFEVELPTVITLKNGASVVVSIIVDGLYDSTATAKVFVK